MNAADIRDLFRDFFIARGHLAGFALLDVPGGQGRAYRAPGVAGGGLDIDVFEGVAAQELTVGHAV